MLILPPHTSSQHQWIIPNAVITETSLSKEQGDSSWLSAPNPFSLEVLLCCGANAAPSKKTMSQCRHLSPKPQGNVTVLKMQRAVSSEDHWLTITPPYLQGHQGHSRNTGREAGVPGTAPASPLDVHHHHYQRPTGNVICLADCRHVLDCSSTRKGISAHGSVTGVNLDTPLRYSVLCAHRAGKGTSAGWWCPSIMIPWHKFLLLTAMLAHEASQGSYFPFSTTHQKKTTTYTVISQL